MARFDHSFFTASIRCWLVLSVFVISFYTAAFAWGAEGQEPGPPIPITNPVQDSGWRNYYGLVSLAGAIGGIIFGFKDDQPRRLRLPIVDRSVDLGFLADAITGASSACALILFLGPSFGLNSTDKPQIIEVNRSLGLAIVAGFAGRSILQQLSTRLQKQIDTLASEQNILKEKTSEAERRLKKVEYEDLIVWGDIELGRNDYELASHYYQKAIAERPDNVEAKYGLAMATAYQAETNSDLFEKALSIFDEIIELAPAEAGYWYNRACTKNAFRDSGELAANSISIDSVLQDLIQAFNLDASGKWRKAADSDSDLESLKSNSQFKALLRTNA